MARGIYVGILVRVDLDELWRRTQDPALHQRWDLRFSEIRYLPKEREDDPQRFLYATRLGLGARIEGAGESLATRESGGVRVSSLKFWSDDPKSLIREGSGYWRYRQHGDAVYFCTYYDYRTRFGALGAVIDRLAFRPSIGWATAWSFDRLRLWLERGVEPEASLRAAWIHALARGTLAFVIFWHGLVPKLLFEHPDESRMLTDAGFDPALASRLVRYAGWAELAFALLLLVFWRARWPLWLVLAGTLIATTGIAVVSPQFLRATFDPLTLNACVAALCVIALLAARDAPSASRCARDPRAEPPA
jgi:hypothetical protein